MKIIVPVLVILALFFIKQKKTATRDVSNTGPGYLPGFQGYPSSG